ncbi:hypothetical protein [Sulfitobacter pacificus]|uniref:hypothetical protein n=1 Tax=Sulfitobacter pacificus TaxID=1499314 RepID=UPI003341A7BA
MDADTRTLAAGTVLSIPGVGDYTVVDSGQDLTLTGGLKVTVSPDQNGRWQQDAFGVVADGLTDDHTKLTALLSKPKVRLHGDILISAIIKKTTLSDIDILSDSATTITFTGSAGVEEVIAYENVNSLKVRGDLTIDCDEKACIGLEGRFIEGALGHDLEGINAINPKQVSPAVSGAHGIQMLQNVGAAPAQFSRIQKCRISNVTRSVSGGVCSAITVQGFAHVDIQHNDIDGVHTGSGTVDADGIKVFSATTGAPLPCTGVVANNKICNCEGRWVKTQVRGNLAIHNNRLGITEAINLITEFRGIDCQVDGSDIDGNNIEISATWTGGTNAILFYLRVPDTAPDYTGQLIKGRIGHNPISTVAAAPDIKRIVYLDLGDLDDRAYTVHFDVVDGFATSDAGWGGGSIGVFGMTVDVPVTWAAGATAHIRIVDNAWETSNFLEGLTASGGTAAHGGLGDLTGKLFLTIQGNSNPTSGIPLMDYETNDCFTSSLVIRGNAVGQYGNHWEPPFDMAEFIAGEVYIGGAVTPAHANTPGSYTFGTLRREGAYIEVNNAGGVGYKKSWDLIALGTAPTWNSSNFTQNPTGGVTGGTGSAGSGNQYVTLTVNGTSYKVLHDGTI